MRKNMRKEKSMKKHKLSYDLKEEGYGKKDIARLARVSLDFVEKTLAE